MVRKPSFKLEANGKNITDAIKRNLLNLNFDDKEGFKSDEISFQVFGIYAKPAFGDKLKLWLGWANDLSSANQESGLYFCGSFSVQTVSRDYKAKTTEVRATAVNFASPQKDKKRCSWENTSVFAIAGKIAEQNNLNLKTTGADQPVMSELQDGISDIEFLYTLCFKLGYKAFIKNDTVIVTPKEAKGDETQTSGTSKNNNLPEFSINLTDLSSLEITEANRNSYTAVILEWQDISSGKTKSIKVGKGEQVYKMQIPEPKSDNEAFKRGEAKLNELQRGGISGRCETLGANIVAGGKLKFKDALGLEKSEFTIKSVSHKLSVENYSVEIEFEG